MHILVIDDDRLVRRAMSRLLTSTHAVTLAEGGAEALGLVREGRDFDAILCDFRMPGLTGRAFYAELEALSPALAHRVIFMSGGAGGGDDDTFLKEHHALTKPFELPDLNAALEALERSKGSRGP